MFSTIYSPYPLSMFGLVLDIVGVIGLFRYGLPTEVSKGWAQTLILEQQDDAEATRYERYKCLSRISLSFLVLGFIAQLFSSLWQWSAVAP